jgi:hypothetical protein
LNKHAIPAISGISAPFVMAGLWSIASLLRPGYDQLRQRGSELGTGQSAIVMNANFAITGFLIISFSLGLLKTIRGGYWSKAGALFLVVCGVAEVATAGFSCDPGCPLTGSVSQITHTGIAVVFFGSIAIAPLLVSFGLEQDAFWKTYRSYSLITGLLSIGGFVAFSWAVLSSFQYIGLIERLFLAAPFQWIGFMANHLRSFY